MVESAMHAPDMTDPQNMGEAQLIEAAKKVSRGDDECIFHHY